MVPHNPKSNYARTKVQTVSLNKDEASKVQRQVLYQLKATACRGVMFEFSVSQVIPFHWGHLHTIANSTDAYQQVTSMVMPATFSCDAIN